MWHPLLVALGDLRACWRPQQRPGGERPSQTLGMSPQPSTYEACSLGGRDAPLALPCPHAGEEEEEDDEQTHPFRSCRRQVWYAFLSCGPALVENGGRRLVNNKVYIYTIGFCSGPQVQYAPLPAWGNSEFRRSGLGGKLA